MNLDYQVKVTVRNGRIVRLMRQHGIESVAELARQAGVNYGLLVELIAMKASPVGYKGNWRDIVLAISSTLRVMPEDLFSEQQMTEVLKKNTAESYMTYEQIAAMTHDSIEASEARMMVTKLFAQAKITDRQRDILRLKMEGATYGEVAAEYGVTGDRIRQIEHNAMRKLKTAAHRTCPVAGRQ